ncbi:S41 family peptidase [Spirosoma aerophilum]
MFRYLYLVWLFVIIGQCASAQVQRTAYNPNRLIAPEQLRADFDLMQAALDELHPSLYWYTPKDSLQAAFARTRAAITQPLTEQTFLHVLYPLICQIRCGHTQLEPGQAWQSSPVRPKLARLPVDVFVRDQRAWIVAVNATDTTVTAGDELLSINDVPIANVIQAGLNIWNADGFNRTWKEFFLNEYDFFEDVCGRVYGWSGPYKLQVRSPTGFERTVTVSVRPKPIDPPQPAKPPLKQSASAAKALARQKEEAHKRSYLTMRWLADSTTAILTVNGLEYGNEQFYQRAFEALHQKQAKNLILDIRRNHGGDARIINELLSFLADSNYVFLQKAMARVADPGKSRFAHRFDANITRSFQATYEPGQKSGDWYTFSFRAPMNRLMTYQPAKANRFRGNLYVLIGGGTFSNAANFTSALKVARPKTVFIGQETGGAESGCGGNTNRLTLPNSQIVVQFPWMRFVSASHNPKEGYGTLPDYPVDYSAEAVINQQDLDLEKALELIRARSR